jgi:hypothetical protein
MNLVFFRLELYEGLSERNTHRHRERPTHKARRDLRDEISATTLLPRETYIKVQSNYFYFYFYLFLLRKFAKKSPMKTYMVKRVFWKISKKKIKSRHFKEGKKKEF